MGKLKKLGCSLLALLLVLCFAGQNAGSVVKAEEAANSLYQVRVNRAANCVTVYQLDEQGVYQPLRSFACSVGKNVEDTPLGSFATSDYYDWRLMVDGSYGQYAVRFYRSILFHSVPYYTQSPNSLESDQYNLLGSAASLGCVRMAVSDVKWIYDNCPKGTSVIVYDDAQNPGPLGKPVTVTVAEGHPFSNWDMTDLRPENPWRAYASTICLTKDYGDGVLYLPVGATQEDLQAAVGAISNTGVLEAPNTYFVYVNGNYDLNTSGVYRIWVKIVNAYGVSTEQEMILAVCQ